MEEETGWTSCLVDDIIVRMTNGCSAKQFKEKVGFPITRIETIWNETIDLDRVKYIKETDSDLIHKYSLMYGDILLSHINSDSHLGKTAIFKNQCKVLIHGINLLLLRPNSCINADFLNYQFKFLKTKGKFIEVAQRAVNQSSINQRKIKSFDILLPPLPEQRAIVSKIEQLFSELDNGVSNLKLAQEQLKVYRQAVLKKAFEGELTKEWRKQHADLPDADELLVKIKREREEAAKATGKNLKIVEPLTDDEMVYLSKLPMSWRWVKIGDVSNCLDSQRVPVNKSERLKRTGTIPYYGANGQVGWIDDYLFDEPLVLVVEDETFTGREKPFSYIITGKSWVNNHAHILQTTSGLNIDFLNYQLSYYPFTALTTGTTGRKKLTQHALSNAAFRFCSLREQQAIVQEIETRLSVCDKLERDIAENLEKVEALRQSILKKAFEGKLLNERELKDVRNTPDWEPAEVLLERMKTKK